MKRKKAPVIIEPSDETDIMQAFLDPLKEATAALKASPSNQTLHDDAHFLGERLKIFFRELTPIQFLEAESKIAKVMLEMRMANLKK